MLVNCKEMLNKARKENYAVPQFNINNLEWTKYILEECQSLNSPVILGVSEGAKKYMGGYNVISSIVKALIIDLNITIPISLHLDHGSNCLECKKAIDSGFTSVMIDASMNNIDENIKITNEVINYAHKKNVTVETEIGIIKDNNKQEELYAKIEDVEKMVKETKVDFIAPALGSVHGLYKGEPKLDFNRMKIIKEKTNIPLVLHGGTGIYDELIKESIKNGICKININTDLQISWANAVKKGLQENKKIYDPRKIISLGETAIKEKIKEKVILFGSYNKAQKK